jgi:hypothetical protein
MEATLIRGKENISYYAEIEKTPALFNAGKGSVASRMYLPASWAGKRVLCLLLEEPDE